MLAKRILGHTLACFYRFKPYPKWRQFHAFCVGLPRSGTHSVAYMLAPEFSSEHEPLAGLTIDHIIRFGRGEFGTRRARSLLRARDCWLQLEMESAHYLHHVTELLVEVFPQAKFILTVRDPRSWLESEINRELTTRRPRWAAIANYRYGRYRFPKEAGLPATGRIYGLSAYLQYWGDHIKQVVSAVPPERLLILNVGAITSSAEVIAEFLGVDPARISVARGRAASLDHRPVRLRDVVDGQYLDGLIERHCADSLRLLDRARSFPIRPAAGEMAAILQPVEASVRPDRRMLGTHGQACP